MPAIRVTHATKMYGDVAAVKDVTLTVPRGARYGLVGPNGAGKTTILSILAGLRVPTSGDVESDPDARIAVMPDTPAFEPWLTARETLAFSRGLAHLSAADSLVEEVLAMVGLVDVADRRVKGFSRGMLQRLGLGACLVLEPDVLLLDEPFSALDPAGRQDVLRALLSLPPGTTVVLSTHILEDIQRTCDRVGILRDGGLVFDGSIEELLAQSTGVFRIRVRAPSEVLVNALRAASWTTEVLEFEPGDIRVSANDLQVAEAELPKLLVASGSRLMSMSSAGNFEAAFLAVTQ